MNEDLKGLIEEMLDIYGDFEDSRYRNGNFTRETIRYIAEMERIHCQEFPSHVNWKGALSTQKIKSICFCMKQSAILPLQSY